MWYQLIFPTSDVWIRSEVRNFLTEKCENCTIFEPFSSMVIEIRFEQAESTASGFAGRQSCRTSSAASQPDSIVTISASSSTRSGRIAATMHWKSRCAFRHSLSGMSCKIRSYVSSRLAGNSFRASRILEDMHRRRLSSWKYTHLNLSGCINNN